MGFFAFLFVPVILFLALVAPIWIIAHYMTSWRTAKTLSSEDETLLAELWANANKTEQRIRNLERILDAEVVDWREKT
jgi:phage shock protein B